MAFSLATFVKKVKRKTRYGNPATTSDAITDDIVHYINQRGLRLWRRYPWHWNIVEFSISISANEVNYTLDSEVGDIIAIDSGQGGYLKKIATLKQYLERFRGRSVATDPGSVSRYVRMGRASTKALKIKVWRTPTESATLTGWGKKRLDRYIVADIATNTDMEFFPDEVLPVLEAGVLSDIYEAQGKTMESAVKEDFFTREMERMVSESTVEEDSEEERAPSDYMVFHKRMRGGTTVT